ncbi:YwmB family TATA-box binding protein [Peribacillus sp. SCS-155]|uniref:YwmB family TATA-box binding protein n=1 Tax=Peribacillus sedimenti TaxID=3115297 RepID=UPI003906655D
MIVLYRKLLPYILFLGFIIWVFGNSTIVAKSKYDIVTIAETIQQEQKLNIEEWSVIARENSTTVRNLHDFQQEAKKLQHEFHEFDWKLDSGADQAMKVSGVLKNADTGLTESIKLVASRQNNVPNSYIIYEIKGHNWDNGGKAFFNNVFESRINDIFRGKPSIFSCVKGVFSDNIDTVLTSETERLLDLFHADEVESVKEKNFVSVSSHTDLFKRTLSMEKLNLQVALRTEGLGGKTTFVVGTPIITFEY